MSPGPKRSPRKPRGGIRARTRELLLDAAARQFAENGVGGTTIQEIAVVAGLANGTFYNYFRTKEEVVDAVGDRLVGRLHEDVAAGSASIADPAERVAVGSRRFILQASRDPIWGAAMLRMWGGDGTLSARAVEPGRRDLRAGRRRGRFSYRSEDAAIDLLQGAVLAGMRTVLEGRASDEHATAVVALVLRGLGIDAAEADVIAAKPLPTGEVERIRRFSETT